MDDRPYEDLRVLYLEDEPLISMDTADFLRELGFGDVRAVLKLKAAHAALDQGDFDLAILDINLGRGETSMELGRSLLAAGTPVIFASGNGADSKGLVAEGFRFLEKPFSHNGLKEEVRDLMTQTGTAEAG